MVRKIDKAQINLLKNCGKTQPRPWLHRTSFSRHFDGSLWSYLLNALNTLNALILPFVCLLISGPALATGVSGEISRIGDATHIEFRGQNQWEYEVTRVGKRSLRLVLSSFDLPTEAKLKTWSDALVSSVDLDKGGADGKYIVTFNLTENSIDSFDYLTDDPSRLIIDIYREAPNPQIKNKADATASNPEDKKSEAARKRARKIAATPEDYVKKGFQRSPSGSELLTVEKAGEKTSEQTKKSLSQTGGVFDGNDPDFNRFRVKEFEIKEDAIIASKQNIFIKFPMLQMSSSELPKLLENSPEYVIAPRDDAENKHARFLLTLFLKGRKAAFLKTYEYFNRKFPKSIYDEIVRNMAAEIHYSLYQEEKLAYHFQRAYDEYQYLLAKYPESPLAERTELILSYSVLERGEALAALQNLQRFLEKYPESPHTDPVRRAIGAVYVQLGKYEEATQTYERLGKTAKDKIFSHEATYRLGDVAFSRRDYKEAIALYQAALKSLPNFEKRFPNALYNMAESYFWTGDYRNSLEAYVNFLKYFPTHDHDGYAMTRVGELMEIMGVDQGRVMGGYLESYFRFHDSPGAGVARVRMLSQQMKGMKEKELKRAVDEMTEIAVKSSLPKMDEFINLMVSDGFYRRGEYERALGYLVSFYQSHPTSSSLPFFHKRILKNITDDLKKMAEEKRYMDVLGKFSKLSATWLKKPDRLDIPYFLGQAYEQAGVYNESEKIYSELLANLKKIKGTQEEKERRVIEHLPQFDELYLRLSTNCLLQRDVTKAHGYLTEIKNPEAFSSQSKIEWMGNLAKVAEEKGKTGEVIKYLLELIEAWKKSPEMLGPAYLKLAEMQIRQKQWPDAETTLNLIRTMKTQKMPVGNDVWVSALEKQGDVLYQQKKNIGAVEAYLELLDQFENKRPLAYVRYKVGSILYETGDIRAAEKVWGLLKDQNGQIYKKLAAERLQQAEWQDSYKKYLNRIPAMSGVKGE
jgi:tetratricopeptide (TPR) repeat protein